MAGSCKAGVDRGADALYIQRDVDLPTDFDPGARQRRSRSGLQSVDWGMV